MYKFKNLLLHPETAAGAAVETKTEAAASTAEAKDTEATEGEEADTVAEEAQKRADAMLAKKLKGMPKKEELDEFRKWKDSQKTPEQKESEELQRLRNESAEKDAKLLAYEHKEVATKAGIAPEFADFVVFEAGKGVTETIDFDTALAAYLKANPQYKGTATAAGGKTAMQQSSAPAQMSDVEAAFYKNNPQLKD